MSDSLPGRNALKRPFETPVPVPDSEVDKALLEGAEWFRQGDLGQAHACFQTAHRRRSTDPLSQSWYGLTLILVERNNSLGLRYCEESVRRGGATLPEAWLNLGRAYRALGHRVLAVRALGRGGELAPDNEALKQELRLLGTRRPPVLGFLSRSHPVNRFLGQIRHKFFPLRETPE
jgi:tetratricopeptide (TPR) repeat protein